MRRIIVGFDGSSSAASALSWAMSGARRHGADLVALVVLDGQPTPVPEPTGHRPPADRPVMIVRSGAAGSAAQ